jgi:hypothetical protein
MGINYEKPVSSYKAKEMMVTALDRTYFQE